MPLRKTKFAVFDTSVYIENFRSGRFTRQILESSLVPRCSVVVLHELLRGARAPLELRFVRDLLRHCQVLTPSPQQWIQAAELLRAIRDRERYEPTKIRDLAFDVLIALSARGIGATLITCNESDFRTIRRYLTFHVLYWR
ncbi:MAG: PIN domain-containing protein [Candidatus Rokubacteria bacterium]|nr:PIN domain-containing protein [Candidatus Rokubacteria bacterium]